MQNVNYDGRSHNDATPSFSIRPLKSNPLLFCQKAFFLAFLASSAISTVPPPTLMCLCIGDLHSVLTFDSFNGDFCVFSFRSMGFGFSGDFRFQVVEKS
ncbi:hypothetical protein SLEP1_g29935 [Rubroshorea leprosula]|uniref:Uncharacterized protein n=1 Tax=Rubroshorea leprosula TaxID=152421 RepID=A0AAV5K8V9_9ROSI|nr:hypothetical protein SLEP1_g29935 [Rubroshorea leprosula]